VIRVDEGLLAQLIGGVETVLHETARADAPRCRAVLPDPTLAERVHHHHGIAVCQGSLGPIERVEKRNVAVAGRQQHEAGKRAGAVRLEHPVGATRADESGWLIWKRKVSLDTRLWQVQRKDGLGSRRRCDAGQSCQE